MLPLCSKISKLIFGESFHPNNVKFNDFRHFNEFAIKKSIFEKYAIVFEIFENYLKQIKPKKCMFEISKY